MSSARSGLRWLIHFLRLAICGAAVLYLYYAVPWTDRIILSDKTNVRLLDLQTDSALVRWPDGREERLALERIDRVGPDQLLNVQYGIMTVARQLNARYALLALILFGPVPFMASQRLVWMLAVQNVPLRFADAVKLTFVGNFFNYALPGSTGGDLVKAYYITKYTHHKTEAVTTVFLDRVVGLLGLMMLASITFVASSSLPAWEQNLYRSVAAALLFVWIGLAAGCMVVFSQRLRTALRLSALVSRLPAGEHLLRIGRATIAMRRHKRLILMSLGITVVLQTLVVVSAWCLSLALGMQGGFVLYFVGVAVGFLVAAIPIAPPQGFGVMEALYLQFFTQGGLNMISQAFALALAVRIVPLLWALPGAIIPLLGLHVPQSRELEEIEVVDPPGGAGEPALQPAAERQA